MSPAVMAQVEDLARTLKANGWGDGEGTAPQIIALNQIGVPEILAELEDNAARIAELEAILAGVGDQVRGAFTPEAGFTVRAG